MLKIAVFAPMPIARTATTAIENDGARKSTRNAYRKSATSVRHMVNGQ
jgi:hypothetical protein